MNQSAFVFTASAIEKLCKQSCKAAKKPTDGRTALVYLVFGIKGIDTRSIDRRHVLEDKKVNIKDSVSFRFHFL